MCPFCRKREVKRKRKRDKEEVPTKKRKEDTEHVEGDKDNSKVPFGEDYQVARTKDLSMARTKHVPRFALSPAHPDPHVCIAKSSCLPSDVSHTDGGKAHESEAPSGGGGAESSAASDAGVEGQNLWEGPAKITEEKSR